jgi:hypothetical protein
VALRLTQPLNRYGYQEHIKTVIVSSIEVYNFFYPLNGITIVNVRYFTFLAC